MGAAEIFDLVAFVHNTLMYDLHDKKKHKHTIIISDMEIPLPEFEMN